MDEAQLNAIIESVLKELAAAGAIKAPVAGVGVGAAGSQRPMGRGCTLTCPTPTTPGIRTRPQVKAPYDVDGLKALMASTTSRIGVGRAGPRYTTQSLLLFQSDHAVTQDTLYRDVDQRLLDDLGLFTVQTQITGGKEEYLLALTWGACSPTRPSAPWPSVASRAANVQVVVGDKLAQPRWKPTCARCSQCSSRACRPQV